ncbi:hypothetical protein KVR01_005312 [Diaporthe batatas]|uniref:uncharacterized protein n=1 Tax=Diaporthe batatas TaxID=748121 RepID=UPI001D04BB17|nr:uncharacterized protein KVR01_005312 [Diaporthe batatas]KAG8165037.1 hypothetical protein KVR01_005312 [Diaporthe batatas]
MKLRMSVPRRWLIRWPLTWRQISSLSASRPPQKLGHKALLGPSCPRSSPRVSRAPQQRLFSTLSPERPTENIVQEPASTLREPTMRPEHLLLSIFEDLVPRGLLPRVTKKPPSSTAVGHGSVWTATVTVAELGVEVTGHGSSVVFAEVAAAIQLDLALRTPEVVAKLSSWPQAQFSLPGAKDIIQSYWQFAYNSKGALKRLETRSYSGAFEARIFAGDDQIGVPVTSAAKDSARGIQDLTLAHQIISGHPDLWPMSPENPFQASIVLDRPRLEKLQQFITAATDYIRTTPEQLVRGRTTQEGGHVVAPRQDMPDLELWLAALPFPPSTSKMLIVGASLRCLEHAIVLAAVGKHAIYRTKASPSEEHDGSRDPAFREAIVGDHPDLLLLFQRVRDAKWFEKKKRRIPKTDPDTEDPSPSTNARLPDHKSRQTASHHSTEPSETAPTNVAAVARRFDLYDPDGIASVSASAEAIERFMITAGLAGYPKTTSHISVPESELKIRAEPYGGDLSCTAYRTNVLRHLLVLGFPENIAHIGHGTLAPGQPPQLRIGSRQLYIDSPLKAHMPQKQLHKTLGAGPMMVVTGITDDPRDSSLSARYRTPISTWEAVLLGKDLKLPGGEDSPVAGAAQVLINDWLPVLVRSEVQGVSHEQARDTLFEAREALHRAIDKAVFDYVKYSWQSPDFYELLVGLPNEDSLTAKAVPKKQREGPPPRMYRRRPKRK